MGVHLLCLVACDTLPLLMELRLQLSVTGLFKSRKWSQKSKESNLQWPLQGGMGECSLWYSSNGFFRVGWVSATCGTPQMASSGWDG